MTMAPTKSDIKSCIGKTKWKHEASARFALAELRKNNPGVFDSMVRPYRCRVKGKRAHWHRGHDR